MFSNTEFLFTYGTLMQGFENPFARRLRDLSTFEGEGSFPGRLYKIEWYPGATFQEDCGSSVFGEVYKLTAPALLLPELDEYEDVLEDEQKSLYLRKIIPVSLTSGTLIPCWAYIYNQEVDPSNIIRSGNFRQIS